MFKSRLLLQGGYEKVFRRGTLTAMKLLIATEQTKPELTVKLSRSLWMRMWSKVMEETVWLRTYACTHVHTR